MKTVILCGGKGMRYDSNRPKVLAMIGDKSILHHVMEIYSAQGFKDFILATGWKSNYISEYFESIESKLDYDVTFVDTGENTNTGGRIKLIQDYIPENDKCFFCTYADGIANVNLHRLNTIHMTKGNIATITVIRPYNQFGLVKIDKNDQIKSFEEKPRMNEYTNGGFFVFNKEIFDHIENNDELEIQVFNRLTYKNSLGAFKHEGFWDTLNTPKDETRLNDIYNKRTKNGKCADWFDIK